MRISKILKLEFMFISKVSNEYILDGRFKDLNGVSLTLRDGFNYYKEAVRLSREMFSLKSYCTFDKFVKNSMKFK